MNKLSRCPNFYSRELNQRQINCQYWRRNWLQDTWNFYLASTFCGCWAYSKKLATFQKYCPESVFVGTSHPDFDVAFEHVRRQLSVTEKILFIRTELAVSIETILLIADLIAESKVLKMKQCNDCSGCSLCVQRGWHIVRVHRCPHEEKFERSSFSSHMLNFQELERRNIQELRVRLGRSWDFNLKTWSVEGRIKAFNVISKLPLSSLVDHRHHLFLGVAKDILFYHYETMRSEHNGELIFFIGTAIKRSNSRIWSENCMLSTISMQRKYLFGEYRNSNKKVGTKKFPTFWIFPQPGVLRTSL